MGLLSLFKKKDFPPKDQERKILLAMPMFNNGDRYKISDIVNNLQSFWNLPVSEFTGDDDTATFKVANEMVAIAFMPVPVPWGDIEGTARYAYNWTTAAEELKEHTGHAIVSIMTSRTAPLERFRILSKIICAILSTSNAIGIYQGNQTLLIPKVQYLDSVEELKQDEVPVLLWVYIGLRKANGTNSAYTYGLTEFGKCEMEVLESNYGLDKLLDLMANICAYVIESDVSFSSGETVGYTAEQKIKITLSKGQFVDGETFKLAL